jgi:uncharacterized protein YkwD
MNRLPASLTLLLLASFSYCMDVAANEFASELQIKINELRMQSGACESINTQSRQALSWNEDLAQLALDQSTHLAQLNQLTHLGAKGHKLAKRVSDSGYEWSALAENLALTHSGVAHVLELWLASRGHANNMCGADYSEFGAARVEGYWTAIFAQPYGH